MRWFRNVVIAVLISGVMLQMAGCVALLLGGAAAATGLMYHEGELRADIDAPPPTVIKATERAFRDLIWTKESATSSATDGLAAARTATGKEVKVTVELKSENTSSIGIRVGTFGDENLSRLLYDKIQFFIEHS